jgi:hypothetical protein
MFSPLQVRGRYVRRVRVENHGPRVNSATPGFTQTLELEVKYKLFPPIFFVR